MTEKDWQEEVLTLARYGGWTLRYHTFDSRHSAAGFPDLVLVRVPELVIAELKTDKGRVSPAQQEWLEALAACGLETHVWRPRDRQAVDQRLLRRN